MKYHYQDSGLGSSFMLADQEEINELLILPQKYFKFIWNRHSEDLTLTIDGKNEIIPSDYIICCTYLQQLKFDGNPQDLVFLFFNKEFYCIHTFDKKVSCNGLLFFGSDFLLC